MDYTLEQIAAIQQEYAHKSQSPALVRGTQSSPSNPMTAPWLQMPDGGFPFSTGATLDTPAIGSGFVDVIGLNTVPNFVVPNGFDGVIRRINNSYNGGGFSNGSGSLIWRILRNGQAVRGYDSILVQLGESSVTGDTYIRLSSGDTVQAQVSNVSLVTGGTQIFFYFGGWFYPKKVNS